MLLPAGLVLFFVKNCVIAALVADIIIIDPS
jgi:hypothetical protein